MLYSANLFREILIHPARRGADRLQIVSGYATAAMLGTHLAALDHHGLFPEIELIIGMTPVDGIDQANHEAFKKAAAAYPDRFLCSYVVDPPGVHSKVFLWSSGDIPKEAFIGSANYTQRAFREQWETMARCSPQEATRYFDELESRQSLPCTEPRVLNFINVHKGHRKPHQRKPEEKSWAHLESVSISFLTRTGALPERSGLNWGQRNTRNRDEAYIPLSSNVYKTDFFPPVGIRFILLADDNEVLVCTRAQANGKAIVTPDNNSLLGAYFRRRLGLAPGTKVEKKHLERYGRMDVTIYKLDGETYWLDFSRV